MYEAGVGADRGQSRGTMIVVSYLKAAHCDVVGHPLR